MRRSLELVVRAVVDVEGLEGDTETIRRFGWHRIDHRPPSSSGEH